MPLLTLIGVSCLNLISLIYLFANCLCRKTKTKGEGSEESRRMTLNEPTVTTYPTTKTMTHNEASKESVSPEAKTPRRTQPIKVRSGRKDGKNVRQGSRPKKVPTRTPSRDDLEEPSAGREASVKEEKPHVEQTITFSWNSNGKRRKDQSSSLDEFDRPTPLLEMTATDIALSTTQVNTHSDKPNNEPKTKTTTTTTTATKESKTPSNTQTTHHSISAKTPPIQQVKKSSRKKSSSGSPKDKPKPKLRKISSGSVATARLPQSPAVKKNNSNERTAEHTQSTVTETSCATDATSNRSKEEQHKKKNEGSSATSDKREVNGNIINAGN